MLGNRTWLSSYPAGMPHEVDLTEFPSIVSIIEHSCEQFRSKPAFENMGVTLSYDDIDRQSRAFAAYLIHHCRLKKGDRVAIMLPNVLQYPVAIFGVLRAGMTVVNTNPMYTARELKHQLNDSGASAIVVLDNFGTTLADVIRDTQVKHVIATGVGDLLGFPKGAIINFMLKHVKKAIPDYRIDGVVRFKDALAIGAKQKLPQTDVQPEDIAFLQYTGGTTGVSKGAMLTHRNLVANMQQAATWIGSRADPGNEHIITALPLYHIFALTANCLVFMKFGATNHLITNPRDMAAFCKDLQRIPFTCITGVNTLFNGLLNAPHFAELDFSHLKFALGGGMAVQRAVAERWKQVTGCTLSEAYGLTETSPAVSMNPLDQPDYNGSIGLPVPSTEVCIQDEEFNQLAQGEVGELCVRGPQVMKGYWMRPDETAKVIDKNGWLHTGDMAKMDEKGFFFIVDRKKDMILVSGFNVYPNEIEDVIAGMPGVLEVAAVGVPDDKSGEAVKIVIVKKDPGLTAEMVKAHCKEHLTGYKQPRYIEFRTDLPKSNVGKILRRELRDSAPAAG